MSEYGPECFRKDSEGVDEELRKFFPDMSCSGFFLDIGACHPIWLSNSMHFELAGWVVACVEPNPKYAAELKKCRRNVFECAAYSKNVSTTLLVHGCDIGPFGGAGFSTISEAYSISKSGIERTVEVEARTMEWLMDRFFPEVKQIDIVSIDVEGCEEQALTGLNVGRFRPKVLVIENTRNVSCAKILGDGYVMHNPTTGKGYNEFFVLREFHDKWRSGR